MMRTILIIFLLHFSFATPSKDDADTLCVDYDECKTPAPVLLGIPIKIEDIPSDSLTPREQDELSKWKNDVYYWGQNARLESRIEADGKDVDPRKFPPRVRGSQILYRYEVQDYIGRGSFGMVVGAYDHKRLLNVVLKIVRRFYPGEGIPDLRFNDDLVGISHEARVVPAISAAPYRGRSVLVFKRYVKDLLSDCNAVVPDRRNIFRLSYIRTLIGDIAAALYHLHEKNIVHCDVKPANILMNSKNRFYLADFGLATKAGSTHSVRGTMMYLPPETFFQSAQTYLPSRDIWALGIMIFSMVTKRWLVAENDRQLLRNIKCLLGIKSYELGTALCGGKVPWLDLGLDWAAHGYYGRHEQEFGLLSELVRRILTLDPTERATAKEILKHPFMSYSNSKPSLHVLLQLKTLGLMFGCC